MHAQFDALVVNLHTSIGAFVAPGPVPVFLLVDARAWYVMADYRETELAHIAPGMEAEVYVLTAPRYRFRGRVQGIGWAVNPEDQPISAGVPQVKRELNWVHRDRREKPWASRTNDAEKSACRIASVTVRRPPFPQEVGPWRAVGSRRSLM